MLHKTVAVILASAFALAPLGASAEVMPLDLSSIATPAPARPSTALRIAEYALQAVDANLSGIAMTKHGAIEGNLEMKPFSHGGIPMFLVGYALYDIVSGALTRRWKVAHKNAGAIVQIGTNVQGILRTMATDRVAR